MKMHVGGAWVDAAETIDVLNPFDGSVVDTVPRATMDDVQQALATAQKAAKQVAAMTGYERYQILHRASELMVERAAELAKIITMEEGKPVGEANIEVERATEIIELMGGRVVGPDEARGKLGLAAH